jgi:hypothetical protein
VRDIEAEELEKFCSFKPEFFTKKGKDAIGDKKRSFN